MPEILIVSDSLEGGLGQAALSESAYLLSKSWSVRLTAPRFVQSARTFPEAYFVSVPIPDAVRDLPGIMRAIRLLRSAWGESRSPRITHAHGLRSFLVARMAFIRGSVVVTYHGAAPTSRARRLALSWIPRFATAAMCVAPIDVKGWEHRWHWSPFLDTEPVPGLRGRDERSVIPSDPVMVLGWFGRLDHPKRPDIWVEILRQAAMAGMTIRGIVIGAGPLEKQIRAAVQSAEVDVEFLGEMGPAEAFSRMDVLLTWSDSEGVPFTIQEAIWAGIPCLSNDLPGPRVLLRSTPGSIVDENNVIPRLKELTEPAARMELGASQLEHIAELLAMGKAEVTLERQFGTSQRT